MTRARSFRASRSFSFAIQARAICWPSALASSVSIIFSNCSGDRFSRFRFRRLLDAVLGVAGLAAAAVHLPDSAAPHVAGGLDGELDDVEEVHGDPRARQHPADGGREDRAHVDGDDLHGVPPGRRGAGQPVRGVIRGAALDLAEQALVPVQVVEADVPPVRELHRFPGQRVGAPAGPAAAVLVDAQVRDLRRVLAEHPAGGFSERAVHGMPRDAGVPGGLRRGDPPVRHLGGGVPQQPAGDRAARRDLRRRLGERQPRACRIRALHPPFDQEEVRFLATGPYVAGPGRHILVHAFGNSPARRARGGQRDPRPDHEPPVIAALGLRHFHAVHPEEHRRRILGRRGLVVFDRHKSGSSGPRPQARRTDTPHQATAQSQIAGYQVPVPLSPSPSVNHST